MPTSPRSQGLGVALYVSYGVGALGTSLFSGVPGLLLLFFMTDTLGISPALGGLALFVGKLWDVVTDPLMGALSDRTNTRWGRRRPWLLVGAITLPLCFVLLFHVPDFATPMARWLWVVCWFTLAATAFTTFQVPYVAMPAEMTHDSHEQTVVMSWRMAFMILGVLASGALAPLLIQRGGGGRSGHAYMASVLALVCFVALATTVAGTHRVSGHAGPADVVAVRTLLRAAWDNRNFRLLVSAMFLQLTGIGALVAVVPYLVRYVLHQGAETVSALFACLVVPAVAAMPAWVQVGKRWGKARAWSYAIGGYALACLPLGVVSAERPWLAYASVGVAGLSYAGTQLFPFSMLPDAMRAGQARSGLRQEGILAGLFTASEKIGMAVGPLVAGSLLAVSGFVESSGAPVTQPTTAILGIRAISSLVPSLCFFASLGPLRYYERHA